MPHHASRAFIGFAAAFLALTGCSGEDPEPTETVPPTPGVDATGQPTDTPSESPGPEPSPTPSSEPSPTQEETGPEPGTPGETPQRGALVTVGNQQVSINTVLCARIDGVWTMSAGADEEVKASVRSAVGNDNIIDSVNVILPEGILVQVYPGAGEASIEHDGDSFVLTGMAQRTDISDPNSSPLAAELSIAAVCEY